MANVKQIIQDALPTGSPTPVLSFGKEITFIRAFMYGIVAGKNDGILRLE